MCSLQGLGVYSLYGLGAWGLRVWGAAEIAGAWGLSRGSEMLKSKPFTGG